MVVLFSGGAVITEVWKDYADAVIMNFYSGCEGGTALAKLLSGDCCFSGKLPFTVARDEKDYPPVIGIGDKPYVIEYGYYHCYTKLEKEGKDPEYPFGFGLSYTAFVLGESSLEEEADAFVIRTNVKNTGMHAGAEVVQVYVGSRGARDAADRPVKLLKGFRKVKLLPRQEREVEIRIRKEDMKFWTPGRWILDPAYDFYVETDSRNARKI